MPNIYGANADLLGKVMDLRLERQNLVMSNLANINVPGYKTRSMDFERELQNELGNQRVREAFKANAGASAGGFNAADYQAEVVKEFKPRTIYGADAVDLDKEMAVMTKNSLAYNTLVMLTQKNYEGIQKIIMEGGK